MTDKEFQAIAQLLTSAKDFQSKLAAIPESEAEDISEIIYHKTWMNIADLQNLTSALVSILKPG